MRYRSILFLFFTVVLSLQFGCSNKTPFQPQQVAPIKDPLSSKAALSSDPASFWNQITTELGLKAKLPPPRFARAYALVQVPIYDALLAANRGHDDDDDNDDGDDGDKEDRDDGDDDDKEIGDDAFKGFINNPDLSGTGVGKNLGENISRRKFSQIAVAAGAASVVLNYLFPADAARIQEAVQIQLALDDDSNRRKIMRSFNLGVRIGNLAVLHGRNDGSDAVFPGPMPTGDCIWTGTNPVLPMCGTWKTWIITDGAEFQPEPPFPCGSEQDLLELDQVYQASFNRTAEQIAIVHKWADLPPPTVWNGYLIERVESNNLNVLASARAFAFLNITMFDAFVCCWNTKYQYWTARPFQRLPEDFTTVITTPNFPSYTSGHSTISGAAAQVMGELFPAEKAFFQSEAEEAAISRFWGGIHYHRDNNQGLAVGKKIGEKVVEFMQHHRRIRLAVVSVN